MIALINGSPKKENSASGALLAFVQNHLAGEEVQTFNLNDWNLAPETLKALENAEVLVIAFPLYVDGIPAHLANNLMQMEGRVKPKLVYGLVNCGFYEGHQCRHALGMLQHWAQAQGAAFGGGVGIGAGGAVSQMPEPQLIKTLGGWVKNRSISPDNLYGSASIPRFLYKAMAQMGWRASTRRYGNKPRDLGWQYDPKEAA